MIEFKRIILFIAALFLVVACQNEPKKSATEIAQTIPARLDSLNQQIVSSPNNAALYNERAIYFFSQKDLSAASKDILQAITIDSNNSNFYVTLSDIFFASGKSSQSKRSLEKSLLLDPNNKEALMRMAELYLYVKDNKKSIEYLDKVLKQDINFPKAYFIKGMNFKEMGDTAKAISSFQTTIEQDPQYYNAFIQLGLLYGVKRNPLAIDYYNNALRIDPKSTEAMYNMGMFYQENNQLNKAIETYTAMLKMDPQNKFANYNLGYIHYEYLKVFRIAAQHFTNAINCDSNYAEAVYMRGLCYEAMGDVGAAAKDYNKSLVLAPAYELPLLGLKRLGK